MISVRTGTNYSTDQGLGTTVLNYMPSVLSDLIMSDNNVIVNVTLIIICLYLIAINCYLKSYLSDELFTS